MLRQLLGCLRDFGCLHINSADPALTFAIEVHPQVADAWYNPPMPPPLCFGGTFNPIHHGHLLCARAAAENLGFDRIVLFPSAQPPHKPGIVDLASAEHRLAMCRLAAQDQPELFEVNDLELHRATPSYTIDTAQILKAQGWPKVSWLIGADMLLYLPQWHRAEELVEAVDFVILARPGWTLDWSGLPALFRRLEKNVVSAPLIDISATQIRQRVKEGRSIAWMTPSSVAEYIQLNRLYR
jgi:nicotinate-nucleotide adenylyltransferase